MSKRLATPEEIEKQLKEERIRHPSADIDALHNEALSEGYKDEICPKCNTIFLAHHHMTNCPDTDCPMKDGSGKSILEMMLEEVTK